MNVAELIPGRSYRHREHGNLYTLRAFVRLRFHGEWYDGVLYTADYDDSLVPFGCTREDFFTRFEGPL